MYPIRTGIAAAILAAAMASTAVAADSPAAPAAPAGEMHEGHDWHEGHDGHERHWRHACRHGRQGHFGPQRMYEKLGLSTEQRTKSDAVFAAHGAKLTSLQEQMRANMEKLRQISPDDPAYAATVSKLAKANGALTTDMISAHGEMRAQLFAVLTPAQKTQFAAMEAKMREHMRDDMKGGEHHWGHRGPPPDSMAPPPPPPPPPPPKQ